MRLFFSILFLSTLSQAATRLLDSRVLFIESDGKRSVTEWNELAGQSVQLVAELENNFQNYPALKAQVKVGWVIESTKVGGSPQLHRQKTFTLKNPVRLPSPQNLRVPLTAVNVRKEIQKLKKSGFRPTALSTEVTFYQPGNPQPIFFTSSSLRFP